MLTTSHSTTLEITGGHSFPVNERILPGGGCRELILAAEYDDSVTEPFSVICADLSADPSSRVLFHHHYRSMEEAGRQFDQAAALLGAAR